MKFVVIISFILIFSFALAQEDNYEDSGLPPPSYGGEDSGPSEEPPSSGGGGGGCEDSASWCSTVTPSQCYNAKDTCCVSCKKHETGNAACAYGDKNQECKKMVAENEGYCDGEGVKEFCCGSCV